MIEGSAKGSALAQARCAPLRAAFRPLSPTFRGGIVLLVKGGVETETRTIVTQDTGAEHGAVLFIPLNRLKPSRRNARKALHAADDIEALAAPLPPRRARSPRSRRWWSRKPGRTRCPPASSW
jgi:hypothetical protein